VSIIYSNYSPVTISLNSPVIYKTGMLDVEHQHVFPRNSGEHARNRLILPKRNYSIQQDSLTSWMEKFSKFNSRDSQKTMTKLLHYLLRFIQSLLLTWIWLYVSPSFSHSQVSGISLRMAKLPKHVAFAFIGYKDYLTYTDSYNYYIICCFLWICWIELTNTAVCAT
jgi:hypothetical protein